MAEYNANINRTQNGKLFINTPEYKELKQKADLHLNAKEKYTNFYGVYETSAEFFDKLVIISAAAVKSDSILRKEESIVCEEICNELNIDWGTFSEKLEEEISSIDRNDFASVEKYLTSKIEKQESKNAMVLFEAALHISLADGMLLESECRLLAAIGTLLNIPTSKMLARLGLFLRQEKEVVVAPPQNFDWLYGAGGSDFY